MVLPKYRVVCLLVSGDGFCTDQENTCFCICNLFPKEFTQYFEIFLIILNFNSVGKNSSKSKKLLTLICVLLPKNIYLGSVSLFLKLFRREWVFEGIARKCWHACFMKAVISSSYMIVKYDGVFFSFSIAGK